ncbi:MAG: hypothetical protein KatS3mg079_865 [Caloramator sp.]|nr:MAG: hypothetical protein KatS3mg079_865 [Caloramator sp.]
MVAEFVVCGYQGVLFPIATIAFNKKEELAEFVEKYQIHCDVLEIYNEEGERVYFGFLD